MFELIRLAIAALGSAAAGYQDLKTSDISDILVFSMIGLGLAIHGVESLMTGSIDPFIASLSATIILGIFALAMYYFGAWGGGDGALLVAIGALLPSAPLATSITSIPFLAIYFVSVFVVGFLYSLAYLSLTVFRNVKTRATYIKSLVQNQGMIYIFTAFAAVALALDRSIIGGLLSILLLLVPFIYQLSAVSELAFLQKIPVKRLKVGDMIGEDIPRLGIFKRKIRGITLSEVRAIRRVKKFVYVRDGVRYGPVFLLALFPTLYSKEIILALL